MNIIRANVDLIQQTEGLNGMFLHIERCGRTCYKSEDRISEGTAAAFVQRMIESNHTAMLEHGTVYLKLPMNINIGSEPMQRKWYHNNEVVKYREIFGYVQTIFMQNPYSVVNIHYDRDTNESIMAITTNYRVIIENGLEDIMNEFICEPTEWHTPRFTLKFTTNIGVTREGNRMRANSIAEESTRYCNYTKEKFGSEVSICPPTWLDNIEKEILQERTTENWILEINSICIHEMSVNTSKDLLPLDYYGAAIAFSNICYNNLIRLGWKPQQACEVLPLATKSDVVYTAFPHQWKHFFDLRLFGKTGAPHPNMKQIAELARGVLMDNELWGFIYSAKEPEFALPECS